MSNNIVALNFETRKVFLSFRILCMLVTLLLVLFQFRLEANIYISMKSVNEIQIFCLRELRKKVNCVIVTRIKARMNSIRENVNELLRFLIDWLTRKVEKNVIDCKKIEFETFELCLRFCACDERDLWLIDKVEAIKSSYLKTLSLIEVLSAILQINWNNRWYEFVEWAKKMHWFVCCQSLIFALFLRTWHKNHLSSCKV